MDSLRGQEGEYSWLQLPLMSGQAENQWCVPVPKPKSQYAAV